MSDISFDLQDQFLPILRAGNLADCERLTAARLSALPKSPFHAILELAISNPPQEVAEFFDEFFRQQPSGKIKAAYTEMNGFDINTDLWFFSPFAYKQYGGHEDYDWLSDWQSEDFGYLPITGFEPLQEVYGSDAFRKKRYKNACAITSLLVVIRFQDLIRRAAPHMKELHFPLLATAHGYEFIDEVRRDA